MNEQSDIILNNNVDIMIKELKAIKKINFLNNFLFAFSCLVFLWVIINIIKYDTPIKIVDMSMMEGLFFYFLIVRQVYFYLAAKQSKFGRSIKYDNNGYEYDVIFTKIEGNYIKIMRQIRIIKDIGLFELKEGLEKLPYCFKKSVSLIEAMALKKYFENMGISVRIDSYQRIPTNLTD
jgi:ribosomal protein L7/L12